MVNHTILKFIEFLNQSYMTALELVSKSDNAMKDESIYDWLQANWELLVERNLLIWGEYLEVYGSGADFNGASSLITDPLALATHRIKLLPKNNIPVWDHLNKCSCSMAELEFDRFVGFGKEFYENKPEFNFALLMENRTGVERVVSISEINFEVERIIKT